MRLGLVSGRMMFLGGNKDNGLHLHLQNARTYCSSFSIDSIEKNRVVIAASYPQPVTIVLSAQPAPSIAPEANCTCADCQRAEL